MTLRGTLKLLRAVAAEHDIVWGTAWWQQQSGLYSHCSGIKNYWVHGLQPPNPPLALASPLDTALGSEVNLRWREGGGGHRRSIWPKPSTGCTLPLWKS